MMNYIPDAYRKKFVNGIRHPYLYLWDSWSYVENNIIHLYCLAISRHKPNGELLEPTNRNDFPFHIRHFTSLDDGLSWEDQGCFLKPEDVSKHNYRTIWSGSVEPMPNGEKLVAFTGLEALDSTHNFRQNIAIGTSKEGYTVDTIQNHIISSPTRDWKTITGKGYYLDSVENLGSNLGEKDGPIMSWRDPFIFYDKDGELNIFWAAKISPRTGALARATLKYNDVFFDIAELHPPVTVPDIADFTQLEVPKIIYDADKGRYYMVIASCNRLHENQPDSEIKKEVRVYTSKDINGPWESLGEKLLGEKNMFGLTILKSDFKNNRLLCIAPYTEAADPDLMLTFAPVFYIYLDELRVEFLKELKTND
ncbi:hypothetical protein [Psychroserpens sp. SPM9]|uniref:hypothetical protein n=1 Tax=Psychroserpens sp. SPM9 TaxID=2975598 RepID=UPI0021A95E5F|nr:hypothetical protein [Psychroserpens sp. SPM9]MDG5490714.1 hypothetical protein [Psychroserpens sp. SPM9]